MKKQPKSYNDVKGSDKRIVVCQGGTRSGKTYSILQVLIEFCYMHRNHRLKIEIVRKTHTALVDTAMADFFEILINEGYYQESQHNKQQSTYKLFGNVVKFTGVDQAQKKRGSKRDILFVNEANDLSWDEFFQLNVRCRMKTIIDYNPSMEEDHWIFTKIKVREDASFFVTTYRDNPYLSKTEIKEIEMLQNSDPYYWSVFGLGEATKNPARIFTYYDIEGVPDSARLLGYGMDFGFSNSPTCVVGVWRRDVRDEQGQIVSKDIILDEVIHGIGMTNHDTSERLKSVGFSPNQQVYADSEDPKSVEELRRMGWRVVSCKKPRDGIPWGINYLKQHRIYITAKSLNAKKEFRLYKWKQDRNGIITNEPVKAYDHVADAVRYLLLSTTYKGKYATA